jgi:hypothetical protein
MLTSKKSEGEMVGARAGRVSAAWLVAEGVKRRSKSDSNFGAFKLFMRHPAGYKRALPLFPASGVSRLRPARRSQVETAAKTNV